MQKLTFLFIFLWGMCIPCFTQVPRDSSILQFTVKEAMKKTALGKVRCEVKKGSDFSQTYYSDAEGKINFKLPINKGTFVISLILKGFDAKRFEFDMNILHDSLMVNPVEMVAADWYMFKGSLYNKDASKFLTYTKVKLKNLNTGETFDGKTNDLGLVYFYVKLRQKYELTTYSDKYLNRRAIINTDCGTDSVAKFCLSGFSYENYMDPEYAPKTIIGTLLLDSIDATKAYQLANIYYDPNKADIKPASAKVLDDLFVLLKDNSSIKIELSSHTDARGDTAKNRILSQQRAEVATKYLVDKGIDKTRIVPKGYGETKLINDCKDGVNCSEEKHKENRRTEFRILGVIKNVASTYTPSTDALPNAEDTPKSAPKTGGASGNKPVNIKIPVKK